MKAIEEMSDKEYASYVDGFRKEQDKSHIFFLIEKCIKEKTGEHMSLEEATFFFSSSVLAMRPRLNEDKAAPKVSGSGTAFLYSL